jgi:hypothetical protein
LVVSNSQDSVEKDPTKVSRNISRLFMSGLPTLLPNYRRVGVNTVETFESALLPIALTATMVNV